MPSHYTKYFQRVYLCIEFGGGAHSSGESRRPLTTILLQSIAIHLPFLQRYSCKGYALFLVGSSTYTIHSYRHALAEAPICAAAFEQVQITQIKHTQILHPHTGVSTSQTGANTPESVTFSLGMTALLTSSNRAVQSWWVGAHWLGSGVVGTPLNIYYIYIYML